MIARAAGVFGVGTSNLLRNRLLSAGHEDLAAGVARHDIISLDQAVDLLDNAYGWDADVETSTELETIRSLIRILDRYIAPSDSDLLHWL